MKKSLVVVASVVSLVAGILLPFNSAQAENSSQLLTCINLVTKAERISHSGKCRVTQEARANWHALRSDSSLPNKEKSTTLTICSNKPTSPVSYQIIRAKCASHQIRTDFYRSTLLAAAPTITKVVATGYESAQVSLAQDPDSNPDAPVAFYTITSSKGQSKNVYTWGELNLSIENLAELTTYSFTVTATTADGTSKVSASSDSVTTSKYVAPPVKSTAAPVAQVSLLSSDTAAVTIPAGATSVAIAAPTLGNPSLSFGSQGAAISATITSAANPAGTASTPFTVSGSTKIVDISVSGLSGSATVCLDASPTAKLWHYVGGAWVDITSSHTSTQVCGLTSSFSPFTGEEQLAAPAFTISSLAETKTVGSTISGYTITSTGGVIASYSISPAISNNPGLSFSTSTGLITGSPTSARAARTYTITATNGSGTATSMFTVTAAAIAYTVGQTGPGGGKIFYVAPAPFSCGPTLAAVCSYLEYAPATWDNPNRTIVKDYWIAGTDGSSIPGAVGTAIGSGLKNSLAIQARNPDLAAATRCLAYRGGGFDDWYLPSRFEADQIFSQATLLGYVGYNTWTSSEVATSDHNAFYMTNHAIETTQYDNKLQYQMQVLPIRAF